MTAKNNLGKVSTKIIQKAIPEISSKFFLHDVVQLVVGAAILAIPVGFTEEVWRFGENLPLANIFLLLTISIAFIGLFIYYNYYIKSMQHHWIEFIERTVSTYLIAFFVVALLLTVVNVAPWRTDFLLAFKRVVIVTFPSSMSAAVADMIK